MVAGMETAPETVSRIAPAAGSGVVPAGRSASAAEAVSGNEWTIAAGGQEAVVVEVGGGLRTYRVDGADLVDGYGADELCPGSAGKVLAPWPNRIRDGRYVFLGEPHQLALTEPPRHNAIHGLVSWVSWRCVAQSADSVTLEHTVPAQPGYPWPLLLRTQWSVGPDGLRVTHEATNLGSAPGPFGLGVHPYLRLPGVAVDDVVLRIPARNRLLLDGRLLPIGAAKVAGGEYDFTEARRIGAAILDTAFGDVIADPSTPDGPAGRSTVTLSTVDGSVGLRIWADPAFRWWQVFTGDTLTGERQRRSVAVEPMTCPPDAFRSGRDVLVLEPGQAWTGTWGITPGLV
jgi:aldose 1-epimerase